MVKTKLPNIKQKLDSIVTNKQLSILVGNKRKSRSYYVKEGFITYTISLEPHIWCQCMGPLVPSKPHVPVPKPAETEPSSVAEDLNNPWLPSSAEPPMVKKNKEGEGEQQYCHHILYLLSVHFRLSYWSICYLDIPSVYQQFLSLQKDQIDAVYLDDILFYEIDKFFTGHECGVCLSSLNDPKFEFDIFKCSTCENYTHARCMREWTTFKNKTDPVHRGCIYCRK